MDFATYNFPQRKFINDDAMERSIWSLNADQRTVFNIIDFYLRYDADNANYAPPQAFVTGGAGRGKSYLISTLCEAAHHRSFFSLSPVLLMAPTGCAAYNIGGRTIHSALKLKIDVPCAIDAKRTSDSDILYSAELQLLQAEFRDTRIIVVDEISMVSKEMLQRMNQRFQQIFDNEKFFGGVCVVFFGDFYQLPPVGGKPAYEHEYWQHLQFYQLFKNERQSSEQAFSALLDEVRVGYDNMTCESCSMLDQARALFPEELEVGDWLNALRIFPSNKACAAWNAKRYKATLEKYKSKPLVINCVDIVKQVNRKYKGTEVKADRELPWKMSPDNDILTGNLQKQLEICYGCIVRLRLNVDVSKGLANGARGEVVGFKYAADEKVPCAIYVRFTDKTIGRTEAELIRLKDAEQWPPIPISPREATFVTGVSGVGPVLVSRYQFPLCLSFAQTVHTVQGLTVDRAVVTMDKSIFLHGQAYVALSRVRTFEGLKIVKANQRVITAHPHTDYAISLMRKRRLDWSAAPWHEPALEKGQSRKLFGMAQKRKAEDES